MKAPISGGISRLRPHHKAHVPRKPLPLYSSPLDLEKTNSNLQTLSHKASTAVDSKTNDQPEAVSTSNSISDVPTTSHASTHAVAFKPRHESTAIELFYDLFFVANLSVFTENNEIGDADCMSSISASSSTVPVLGLTLASARFIPGLFYYSMVHLAASLSL